MRVIFFSKDGEVRSVDTDAKTCVFTMNGKTRMTTIRCPATYAARLVEAGWKIDSIEAEERAGA